MSQKSSRARLWLALPTAAAVSIVNILCFVLFMVVYSYLIDPGHDESYYQDAAGRLGPISSILCGVPLMYLAGRWIGRRVGPGLAVTAAILVWTVYFAIDFGVVAASGALMSILPLFAISFLSKLGAAYLGGRHAAQAVTAASD